MRTELSSSKILKRILFITLLTLTLISGCAETEPSFQPVFQESTSFLTDMNLLKTNSVDYETFIKNFTNETGLIEEIASNDLIQELENNSEFSLTSNNNNINKLLNLTNFLDKKIQLAKEIIIFLNNSNNEINSNLNLKGQIEGYLFEQLALSNYYLGLCYKAEGPGMTKSAYNAMLYSTIFADSALGNENFASENIALLMSTKDKAETRAIILLAENPNLVDNSPQLNSTEFQANETARIYESAFNVHDKDSYQTFVNAYIEEETQRLNNIYQNSDLVNSVVNRTREQLQSLKIKVNSPGILNALSQDNLYEYFSPSLETQTASFKAFEEPNGQIFIDVKYLSSEGWITVHHLQYPNLQDDFKNFRLSNITLQKILNTDDQTEFLALLCEGENDQNNFISFAIRLEGDQSPIILKNNPNFKIIEEFTRSKVIIEDTLTPVELAKTLIDFSETTNPIILPFLDPLADLEMYKFLKERNWQMAFIPTNTPLYWINKDKNTVQRIQDANQSEYNTRNEIWAPIFDGSKLTINGIDYLVIQAYETPQGEEIMAAVQTSSSGIRYAQTQKFMKYMFSEHPVGMTLLFLLSSPINLQQLKIGTPQIGIYDLETKKGEDSQPFQSINQLIAKPVLKFFLLMEEIGANINYDFAIQAIKSAIQQNSEIQVSQTQKIVLQEAEKVLQLQNQNNIIIKLRNLDPNGLQNLTNQIKDTTSLEAFVKPKVEITSNNLINNSSREISGNLKGFKFATKYSWQLFQLFGLVNLGSQILYPSLSPFEAYLNANQQNSNQTEISPYQPNALNGDSILKINE